MELIPVITLALVAVLLVLVIILLARKPVQPPKTTDSGAISALGALVTQNLREGREAQDSRLAAMDRSVSGQLDRFEKRLHGFSVETSQQLDGIRAAVDGNLRELREDNNKKLDEMRGIVDEKLQKTLSDRMNESFRLVNERLEQVYRGLGEMQTLAQGVGDLKKVLTNVKNRGIVGEIQLGAILAVVVLFWNQIWPLKRNHGRHGGASITIDRDIIRLWCKIVVACIPAAVVGLKWNDLFEELFYNYQSVAVALIVFGVAFIAVETAHKDKPAKINSLNELTYPTVLMIGMFQLIAAIFPGTSRSGSTIVGALLLGVSRTVAAEFTFFLAIPVMFGLVFTQTEMIILAIGMVTAFVSSMLIIRMLMAFVKKHDFKVFGWYRIILGIAVLAYFMLAR